MVITGAKGPVYRASFRVPHLETGVHFIRVAIFSIAVHFRRLCRLRIVAMRSKCLNISCKSSARSKDANRANMPSISTTVTEQGGTSSIPSSMPTGQTLLPSSTPAVQTSDMTRGGHCAGKSLGRSNAANHANLPSIPTTVTQQGGASSIPSNMPTSQTLLPSSMPQCKHQVKVVPQPPQPPRPPLRHLLSQISKATQ